MRVLVEFAARLIRRVSAAQGPSGITGRVAAILRELGPYAAIELVLPGGSLLALLLWLHRRRAKRLAPSAADGEATLSVLTHGAALT